MFEETVAARGFWLLGDSASPEQVVAQRQMRLVLGGWVSQV